MMPFGMNVCDVTGCHGHLAKFDDCIAESVWTWSMDHAYVERETGTTEFMQHYALIAVPEADTFVMDEGQPGAYTVPIPAGWYIVTNFDSGAVSVSHYETFTAADAIMNEADAWYVKCLDTDEENA